MPYQNPLKRWLLAFIGGCTVFFAGWVLLDLLPRSVHGLQISSFGVALGFALWWLYGDDTRPLRKRLTLLVNSRLGFYMSISTCVVITLLSIILLYTTKPSEILKKALIQQALADRDGYSLSKEGRLIKLLKDGQIDGWCIEQVTPNILKPGVRRSLPTSTTLESCAKAASNTVFTEGRLIHPLLALANPSIRKRPIIKALRRYLADSGTPSVFLTNHECFAAGYRDLDDCIAAELKSAVASYDPMFSITAEEARDAFASQSHWWVLIDGTDSPGNSSDFIKWVRSINFHIRAREGRVAFNARPEFMKNILAKSFTDDIRELMDNLDKSPPRIIMVHGLLPGTNSAKSEPVQEWLTQIEKSDIKPMDQPRLAHIAADVQRMIALRLTPPEQYGISPTMATWDSFLKWGLTVQFEANCYGELCETDDAKNRLEFTFNEILEWMSACHLLTVSRDEIAAFLETLPEFRRSSIDKLFVALLGTDTLFVKARDVYWLNDVWLPYPIDNHRYKCPSLL